MKGAPGGSEPRVVPYERSEPVPGVRLVTERMPHVRSVSIGLWIDIGSRDEVPDMAGATHLLEHLLFKGTERRTARDIADAVDAVGGELNAYSAKEHTCFYGRVLDDDVWMVTDILLDMFGHALLRPDDLEAERKVVLEEIHMTADAPDDLVHDVFSERAWPGHALGRPVLGTAQTVGSIDRDRLLTFYRDGYVPGRLVIAAAGNLAHDELAAELARVLDPGRRADRRDTTPPPRIGPTSAYEYRETEQAHIVWGGESVARSDPDRYALSVLNTLYGAGMSSRLFQEIRETRGLAYSIYSSYHLYTDGGLFSVYAGSQEQRAAEVLEIVRDQAALLAEGGATPEEVDRAKGHVKGGLVLSMDDPGGRMSRLGRAELLHGEVLTVDDLLDRVEAVTVEDVTRVAKRVFAGDGFVLAAIGPVAEGSLDRFVEPL